MCSGSASLISCGSDITQTFQLLHQLPLCSSLNAWTSERQIHTIRRLSCRDEPASGCGYLEHRAVFWDVACQDYVQTGLQHWNMCESRLSVTKSYECRAIRYCNCQQKQYLDDGPCLIQCYQMFHLVQRWHSLCYPASAMRRPHSENNNRNNKNISSHEAILQKWHKMK